MDKRILVAVDGSVYSSNSLDYLIRLFRNDRKLIIDLISIVPEERSDNDRLFGSDRLRPAVEERKARTENYLKDAKDRLLRNGFGEDQVNFFVHSSPSAVAASLHYYAQKGNYDSLLVGRRGLGKVGEMFMGSVSADLIKKCREVPIWIIDGNVTCTRFLLAVHCSPCSLLAADHLAFILNSSPEAEIYIRIWITAPFGRG